MPQSREIYCDRPAIISCGGISSLHPAPLSNTFCRIFLRRTGNALLRRASAILAATRLSETLLCSPCVLSVCAPCAPDNNRHSVLCSVSAGLCKHTRSFSSTISRLHFSAAHVLASACATNRRLRPFPIIVSRETLKYFQNYENCFT